MVGQTVDDKAFAILMKILSILSGAGIAILGIMDFVMFDSRISGPIEFMMAIYYILFGITGILCEFPIPRFAFYFSFLKKYFGKGSGSIATISMDVSVWWRIIIFVFAALTGILYIVFAFTLRKKLQDEDEAAPQENKPEAAAKDQA